MSVTAGNTSHATAIIDAATTLVWSHVVAAGENTLAAAVAVGIAGVGGYDTVDFGGAALTKAIGKNDANFCEVEIWILNSPTASTANITATRSAGGTTKRAGAAISFSGAGSNGTGIGNSGAPAANPNVTVADSASGDIVISAVLSDLGGGGTTTEAGTLIFEDEDFVDGDLDFSFQRQNASGADTVCSWTANSDSWAAVGVAVKGGVVADTSTPILNMVL